MANSPITEADRETFRNLVRWLLPKTSDLPSGEEVGVAEDGLDHILSLRRDILGELIRGLRLVRGLNEVDAIAALLGETEAWHAMRIAAFGAYFQASQVKTALGYPGAVAHGYDPDATPDYVIDSRLDRVKKRGQLWRKAG